MDFEPEMIYYSLHLKLVKTFFVSIESMAV